MANRSTVLLSVAVKLKLFDFIQLSGSTNARHLAQEYQFSTRGADAVLVGLSTLNLLESFDEEKDWYEQSYRISALTRDYLLIDSEMYLGHLIEMDAESYLTPQGLLDALKSDKPRVYKDSDPWEFQESDKESAERFTLGMRSISIKPATIMAQDPIFKDKHVLLDVGGGSGVHLSKILGQHSHLFGILLEIPSVFATALPYFKQEHVMDRIDPVKSNMFVDPWPQTHSNGSTVDLILLSQILHDWPVSKGIELLQKAFDTLPSGGWVILHEKLLTNDRKGPKETAMVSLDMLFWTEGQQYTSKKLFEMLQSIGFVECECRPTTGYWSLTLGQKP